MATYDELMAAARKADAAGEGADAKRLLEMANELEGSFGATPAGGSSVDKAAVDDLQNRLTVLGANAANAAATNEAARFNAGNLQQTSLANQNATNQNAQYNASNAQAANQNNAQNALQNNQFNAGNQQQMNLANQTAQNNAQHRSSQPHCFG